MESAKVPEFKGFSASVQDMSLYQILDAGE
nr:MAG TPA: hypothetical protein [Caudoviricetes sp.]